MLDVEIIGNREFIKVTVGDFDFYMNDRNFKIIVNRLRKKYPNQRFFCCYQKID